MRLYKDWWKQQPPWIRIPAYGVLGAVAALGFGLLFGMIIVWLWNWLMPAIFGLPEISFWQGVGLFLLGKLIFGGMCGSHSESRKGDGPSRTGKWCGRQDAGPAGDRPPMEHGPMGHTPPETDSAQDFRHWRDYEAWWKTQGKASFDAFVQQTHQAPPPPRDTPTDDNETE